MGARQGSGSIEEIRRHQGDPQAAGEQQRYLDKGKGKMIERRRTDSASSLRSVSSTKLLSLSLYCPFIDHSYCAPASTTAMLLLGAALCMAVSEPWQGLHETAGHMCGQVGAGEADASAVPGKTMCIAGRCSGEEMGTPLEMARDPQAAQRVDQGRCPGLRQKAYRERREWHPSRR